MTATFSEGTRAARSAGGLLVAWCECGWKVYATPSTSALAGLLEHQLRDCPLADPRLAGYQA